MKNYDDERLVQLFIDGGNNEVFEILVNRHRKKIYGYILGIVCERSLADDIFQETFIKVINQLKRGKYAANGKFSAWLMRVAHNMSIDYYRKQRGNVEVKGAVYELDLLRRSAIRDANIEFFETKEKNKSTLRSLICELPEEQREVLVLRYYMDLNFKEIAEHLHIGLNTALGRMRYAIANLKKMINRDNVSICLEDWEAA